jgi:hypothetical protein
VVRINLLYPSVTALAVGGVKLDSQINVSIQPRLFKSLTIRRAYPPDSDSTTTHPLLSIVSISLLSFTCRRVIMPPLKRNADYLAVPPTRPRWRIKAGNEVSSSVLRKSDLSDIFGHPPPSLGSIEHFGDWMIAPRPDYLELSPQKNITAPLPYYLKTPTTVARGRQVAIPTPPTSTKPATRGSNEKPECSLITPREREILGWNNRWTTDRRSRFEKDKALLVKTLKSLGEVTGCYGILYLRPYSPFSSQLIVKAGTRG